MMFILNNVSFYYIAARYFAALLNIGNFVNKMKVGSIHSFLAGKLELRQRLLVKRRGIVVGFMPRYERENELSKPDFTIKRY